MNENIGCRVALREECYVPSGEKHMVTLHEGLSETDALLDQLIAKLDGAPVLGAALHERGPMTRPLVSAPSARVEEAQKMIEDINGKAKRAIAMVDTLAGRIG